MIGASSPRKSRRRFEENGLILLDVENIVRQYSYCLSVADAVSAELGKIRSPPYDLAFQRMWEYYRSCGIAAARASDDAVYDVLFQNDRAREIPLNRAGKHVEAANMGTRGLADLRKEFRIRGWDRKATGRVVSELLLNLAIALGGIYIFVAYSDPFLRACSMILSTAASMGVATNTHTSSHYATSEKRWLNEFLTFFGYPVFLGLSACYWWHQHVVVHHPAPNVVGVDDDVDLAPWFARTKDEVQRSTGLPRFYYQKLQFFVFPFVIGFIGFNMQKASWIRLIKTLRHTPNHGKRPWIDLSAMILHYILWIGVPVIYFAPANVVGFYLLRTYLMGYALFAVLAPGHFPSEAVCLIKSSKDHDYLLLQTAATVNFRTGVVGKLMCSGLEYQIEHHLFPNISHIYYPKMAGLVQNFCRENGLPYRCYAWDTVVWKCLLMLRSPSQVQVTVERLPSLVAAESSGSPGLTRTKETA